MGRRALEAGEGQSRTLAMRLSDQLAESLQRFREYVGSYGGEPPSTSDAVRDLIERGLSESPLGFVRDREEVLRDILKATSRREPLRRELLTFLTDCAHDAYMFTKRSTPDPDLLLNNLLAFKAVVQLRLASTRQKSSDLDSYYLGNLSASGAPLPQAIETAITRLREGATGGAEFLTRNLHVALRDEPTSLPQERLYQVLEPFLPGLVVTALKGFWYREKRAIELAQALHEHLQQLALPPTSLQWRSGPCTLSLIGSHEQMPALLDFGERNLSLSLDYVRLCDLEALVRHPGEGDAFTLQRLSLAGAEHFFVQEREGGFRIGLTSTEMSDLRQIFERLNADPAVSRAREVLDRRFGRI
ncbi:MAG: hypothetical protein ACTHL8_24345 [Burkholderiaceae bacterium]